MIGNVSYEVMCALPKGEEYFGRVAAKFDAQTLAKGANDQLFIDFFGSQVNNLIINGKQVDDL